MTAPFGQWMGLRVEGDHEGVRVSVTVEDHHKNRAGYLHGGVPLSMADTAMGVFLWHTIKQQRPDARQYCMTLEMSSRFVRSAQPGDQLVAVPRVRHVGKTTAVLDADVRNQDDELVLTASATFVIRER